jgi:hypothetical protein
MIRGMKIPQDPDQDPLAENPENHLDPVLDPKIPKIR